MAWIRQGIEQPLQARGPLAGEHITAAHQPAGQVAALQGPPQLLRLAVAGHQQAEIARLQWPFAARRALRAGLPQQQAALQQIQAEACHLFRQGLAVQLQQLQRRFARRQQQLPLAGAGLHRRHSQFERRRPAGTIKALNPATSPWEERRFWVRP